MCALKHHLGLTSFDHSSLKSAAVAAKEEKEQPIPLKLITTTNFKKAACL